MRGDFMRLTLQQANTYISFLEMKPAFCPDTQGYKRFAELLQFKFTEEDRSILICFRFSVTFRFPWWVADDRTQKAVASLGGNWDKDIVSVYTQGENPGEYAYTKIESKFPKVGVCKTPRSLVCEALDNSVGSWKDNILVELLEKLGLNSPDFIKNRETNFRTLSTEFSNWELLKSKIQKTRFK